MYNFKYDLKFGEEGESLVKSLLVDENSTVEVKRDRLVSRTGNIAVEISYKGNPSGLMKTQANWYAFVLSGEDYNDEVVILVKTSRLKKLVETVKRDRGTVMGGDGKQSVLVLVPLPRILDLTNVNNVI